LHDEDQVAALFRCRDNDGLVQRRVEVNLATLPTEEYFVRRLLTSALSLDFWDDLAGESVLQLKHLLRRIPHPSSIKLQHKICLVGMIVTADNHIFSPFVLDPRGDSLVDILIKVIWHLSSSVYAHKHTLHLNDEAIADSLPS
jgi:hypothetical protein